MNYASIQCEVTCGYYSSSWYSYCFDYSYNNGYPVHACGCNPYYSTVPPYYYTSSATMSAGDVAGYVTLS